MSLYYSRMRSILHNATGHFTQGDSAPVAATVQPAIGRAAAPDKSLVRASDVNAEVTAWLPAAAGAAGNTRPYKPMRDVSARDCNSMPAKFTRQRVTV